MNRLSKEIVAKLEAEAFKPKKKTEVKPIKKKIKEE